MCRSPRPISVNGPTICISDSSTIVRRAAAQPSQSAAAQREREQHERGERGPARDDLGRRHVAQADLDEEVGGAPESGQRQELRPGAAAHEATASSRSSGAVAGGGVPQHFEHRVGGGRAVAGEVRPARCATSARRRAAGSRCRRARSRSQLRDQRDAHARPPQVPGPWRSRRSRTPRAARTRRPRRRAAPDRCRGRHRCR